MSEPKSFFTTLPGILTGLAALVTAVVGLLYALSEIGFIGPSGNNDIPPASVASNQPGAKASTPLRLFHPTHLQNKRPTGGP